jgi:hypothetical protein
MADVASQKVVCCTISSGLSAGIHCAAELTRDAFEPQPASAFTYCVLILLARALQPSRIMPYVIRAQCERRLHGQYAAAGQCGAGSQGVTAPPPPGRLSVWLGGQSSELLTIGSTACASWIRLQPGRRAQQRRLAATRAVGITAQRHQARRPTRVAASKPGLIHRYARARPTAHTLHARSGESNTQDALRALRERSWE